MTTDAELVDFAYRGILGRAPEPAAVEQWTARLRDEPKSRLFSALVASSEFHERYSSRLVAGEDVEQAKAEQESESRNPVQTQQRLRTLLRSLKVERASGLTKVRVGGPHDGGYVMLDDFTDIEVAFSCGIGNNCSWDGDLAQRGITVHQFDHTISASPQHDRLFTFHALKLSARPEDGCITIRQIAAMAPTGWAILKIDVEGDEWGALAALEASDLSPFAQVIVEFHHLSRAVQPGVLATYDAALRTITGGFQCVHVHANNFRDMKVICGIPIPDVLEVTFANRRKYVFEETDETFPTPIDAPNNPDEPDLLLGTFRFS